MRRAHKLGTSQQCVIVPIDDAVQGAVEAQRVITVQLSCIVGCGLVARQIAVAARQALAGGV